MPTVSEVITEGQRQIRRHEAQMTQRLLADYDLAWRHIERQVVVIEGQIQAAIARGDDVSEQWLNRQTWWRQTQASIETQMTRFSATATQDLATAQIGSVRTAIATGQAFRAVINTPFAGRVNPGAFERWVSATQPGSPIRGVIDGYGERVSESIRTRVTEGIGSGQGAGTIRRQIMRDVGTDATEGRIATLTRTEVNRAYRGVGRADMTALGKDIPGNHEWEWLASLSPRTCPACFPGDTLVSGPAPEKAFTRHYVGDVIVIETASGKRLTATPNHPILTSSGWIAAEMLNVGGNVVSQIGTDGAASLVNVDNYGAPAPIKEVAESLPVISAEMPSAAPDFHGDGEGSEVYIERSNGLLGNDDDANTLQHRMNLDLGMGLTGIEPRSGSLLPFASGFASFLPRLDVRTRMVFQDRFAVTKRYLGRTLFYDLFERAQLAFGQFQTGIDALAGRIELLSEGQNGLALGVLDCNLIVRQAKLSVLSRTQLPALDSFDLLRRTEQPLLAKVIGKIFAIDMSNPCGRNHSDARKIRFNGDVNVTLDATNAATPHCDSMTGEDFANSLMAGSVSTHEGHHTLSGKVALDHIVSINRSSFSGHVYNLQTTEGWYFAGGIIAHNCLSMHRRRFPFNQYPNRFHVNCRCSCVLTIDESIVPPAPGPRPMTGEEWLREQPVEVQRRVLRTPARYQEFEQGSTLRSFTGVRQNRTWGPSVYIKPTGGL